MDHGERLAMNGTATILGKATAPVLIVGDHASNHVPPDIDLGIDAALLSDHIAIDIGVAQVAALMARDWKCCAILCGFSRLVIDCNREIDRAGLIPTRSDGHDVPGNENADVSARIARFYEPYHRQVAELADQPHAPFILSLHSFTPTLRARPDVDRPWDIGVLYNEDERAARIAVPWLEAADLIVGDQLPYSGRDLNASMNRHAEAKGRPYVGIEMRQDLVAHAQGQARFAALLGRLVHELREHLH